MDPAYTTTDHINCLFEIIHSLEQLLFLVVNERLHRLHVVLLLLESKLLDQDLAFGGHDVDHGG